MTITVSGTTLTFNDSTTMTTAATGTVTSVATGNGLSGGTITGSGTLIIACPTYNTVGSYVWGRLDLIGTITSGANFPAGTASNQVSAANAFSGAKVNNLSGTWKYMAGTDTSGCGGVAITLYCRVS